MPSTETKLTPGSHHQSKKAKEEKKEKKEPTSKVGHQ